MDKSEPQAQRPINEHQVNLVNELLAGGDAEDIARRGKMTVTELFELKDYLIKAAATEAAAQRQQTQIGRNDPCPCGSGKKYKKCCLGKNMAEGVRMAEEMEKADQEKQHRDEQVRDIVEKGYALFAAAHYEESLKLGQDALIDHPHEDRLHDLVQLDLLYSGREKEAEAICRKRWLAAVKDKKFYTQHGYHPHERQEDAPSSPGFLPTAWLSKYWIAKRASYYRTLKPTLEKSEIVALMTQLKTADDMAIFPFTREEGLSVRRDSLGPVIRKLADFGPEVIPYLLPYTYRYSWVCMLIPDILNLIDHELALDILIDITLFQIAFASESSMSYLEKKGIPAFRRIKEAFGLNKEFDPVKTGLISVMARIKTDESFTFLMSLLDHPDNHVVNWTGGALALFGNTAALPKMQAARDRIGSEPRLDWGIEKLSEKLNLN